MKKLFVALLLILSMLLTSMPVYAADGVGKDEIPYGDFSGSNILYKYDTFDMMTEAEAKAAGVPEGYSGYVLKITAKQNGVGIALDLSHIKVKDIEKITFRVYCPATTKSDGVRLTNSSTSSWIMLANPGKTEQWVDIVLDESSNFNTDEKSFDVFDDGNGYCKVVNFCFRFTGANEAAYIDSITVELKAPDTVPPVITYEGEKTVETTAGRVFTPDLTAYDAYYDTNITPEYIWSEGALDADGLLTVGTHTCTVKATDPAGNSSELTLTVKVGEKDATAPTVSWAPETVYACVGMRPVLNVTATDDRDQVQAELIWSEGALDSRGRLVEGEHTLTVSSTDLTGNKTVKQVKVIVTAERPEVG
ncbi:MAG: hypothetical protein IJY39_14205 [Clostridia bacterium]|nr:hypothetical protein [Clostridia bacterium]